MNLGPSGYEPDELPGCSTPRQSVHIRARNGRAGVERGLGVWRAWRRPTLPPLVEAVPWAQRVFTAEFGMGSGVWPLAMATRPASLAPAEAGVCHVTGEEVSWKAARGVGSCRCTRTVSGGTQFHRCGVSRRNAGGSSANRAISTGQLRGLPRFHLRPIDVVVFHGSRRDLVLRRVSRLDAFSGYPVRT